MIRILDTGSVLLSREEFVNPVLDIVVDVAGPDCIIKHYSNVIEEDLSCADKVIICGCPVADDKFCDDLGMFSWVRGFDKPILGICAGMQIIAGVYGANFVYVSEIGMTKIKIVKKDKLFAGANSSLFEMYCVHGKSVDVPKGFDALAESDKCVECIKKKGSNVYGVMFHPEVRGRWIIENFLGL